MSTDCLFHASLLSSPLWTLISWALGWGGLETASDITMALAWIALALALLVAAIASRKEQTNG